MKVTKLKEGDLVEVGDKILADHFGWGKRWYTVHRVTKKYAFVKYNDVAEGKYPREFRHFAYGPIPHEKWSQTTYSAWRPIEPTSTGDQKTKPGV